jgi:hypothetical protein
VKVDEVVADQPFQRAEISRGLRGIARGIGGQGFCFGDRFHGLSFRDGVAVPDRAGMPARCAGIGAAAWLTTGISLLQPAGAALLASFAGAGGL